MDVDEKRRCEDPRPGCVDSWLRQELEPAPEVVERVVQRSLCAEQPRCSGVSLPVRWVAATVLLLPLVVGAVVLLRRQDGSPPVPTITNASGELVILLPVPTPEPDQRTPVIFNEAGVVAAIVPGGEPMFLLSGGDS